MIYTDNHSDVNEVNLPFEDADLISDWAIDSVNCCYAEEIITGDDSGMFNPKGSTSRAELATVIMKVMSE
jgi:hypothetical protein